MLSSPKSDASGAERSRVEADVLLLAGALLVMLFVTSGRLQDMALLPKWMALAALVCLGSLRLLVQRQIQVSKPLLFLLGTYLVSLIPGCIHATDVAQAGYFLAREVCWVAFVLVLATSLNNAQPVLWLIVAGLIVTLVWAGWQWMGQLDGLSITHQATYDVRAGFAHRNLLIEITVLLLPGGLALAVADRTSWRWVPVCTSIAAITLITLLLGRIGWLSILLATSVFLIAYRVEIRRVFRWFHLLPVLVPVVLLFTVVDQVYTIFHHFETAIDLSEGTTRDRWLLMTRSWQLFQSHVLTGAGWGQWSLAVMPFDQFGMLTEHATRFYQRPHNDVLWLLSEGGLLPGLSFLTMLVLAIRHTLNEPDKAVRTWLLAGLMIYVLIMLTGFPLERMEHRAMLGIFLVMGFRNSRSRPNIGRMGSLAGLLIGLFCLYWFYGRLRAEFRMTEAFEAYADADHRAALLRLQEIDEHYLTIDQRSTPISWYKGVVLHELGQREVACRAFAQSLEHTPDHPWVQNSLGVCAYEQGHSERALQHFYAAVRYTTSYSAAWLNIALVQYRAGKEEEAFETLRHADPASSGVHYDQLAMRLALDRLQQMQTLHPERRLRLTIQAMLNTPHWGLDVFKKSVTNCLTFREQVLIDAFYYMLTQCQGAEDCAEVIDMKRNYLPDRIMEINGQSIR